MTLWAFWCVWQGVTLSAWCRLCGVSVSGLVLWLSVWLSGCGGLWSGCVSLVVSVALLVCCVWCCVSGAVVLSGVGLFSGGLVCCILVSGILLATPKMSIHTKRRTTYRSTSPFAYHTINLSSNYSITNFFTPNLVFPNFFSLVDTCFSGVLGVSISTFCTGVFFMIFLVLFIGLLCLMTSSKSL